MQKKKALVIVGPTGVGKTALSLKIAVQIPSEIISADSRQFYRYMDIGTAKPDPEMRENVVHHFIDILNPDQAYSAGQFAADARPVVMKILESGRLPMIVGGSGLYVRALLEGFFGSDIKNPQIREELFRRLEKDGAENLYQELEKIDPPAAAKIHPHNTKRIIRALEVYYASGIPISQIQRTRRDPAPFAWQKIGLHMEREALYKRIEQRVEEMFRLGLVEEVKKLSERGYSPQLNALNTVGYKEVFAYLNGEYDLETCKALIKQNSRRYAKRQLIWFRAEADIHWFKIVSEADFSQITDELLSVLE